MAGDVKVNSLDLLNQYQSHFRNFADCVDVGVVAYRDHLRKKKEEAAGQKQEADRMASGAIDKLDNIISRHEDLLRRYEFGPEDQTRIELEIERLRSRKDSILAKTDAIKEKAERRIGILDDMYNLTYTYGNKTREMSDTANGSLTSIIGTLSNYQPK